VFAYADTDSLHLLIDTDPETLEIDPAKLGAWKCEYEFDSAIYVRAKQYIERKVNGEYEAHFAGLPLDVTADMTFDRVRDGEVFKGKLIPKRVPGGIVLTETDWTLKL
jgi:hypothetical protein